ncbi:carboxymuconolactone decarboxylase family protein [Sinimarinibacterium flocculans]|uniref:Carboxymuconolactone decarboxylase family protein n=1 Tax=Sinimarinibacterium flocculans TaxID=985250 RepID=A0A318E2R8_9GAMM|nr:carboxymuconolactone decarboxylase family protein [Sinimarinibacterium flocculans]PXV64245.1 carboxymuconolactone decarboxylase family protein [Sinimarinibacterium flocculans]
MPRIDVTDDLGSWMALRPDMAPGLVAFSDAVYGRSQQPRRVREIARMRIALANECEVCRNARYADGADDGIDESFYADAADWRRSPRFDSRERLAAEYAERFAADHVALRADDDFWLRLRAAYSDAEIVDLAMCCALWLGTGRTMRTLDVGQSCALTLR